MTSPFGVKRVHGPACVSAPNGQDDDPTRNPAQEKLGEEGVVLTCKVCKQPCRKSPMPPHPWVHDTEFVVLHANVGDIQKTSSVTFEGDDHQARPDFIDV